MELRWENVNQHCGRGSLYPPEALFVWDIERLRNAIENPEPSNLIQVSAVLRRLLCDQSPLLHQANRNIKHKVSFRVCDDFKNHTNNLVQDGLVSFSYIYSIYPEPNSLNCKNVKLDDFLSLKVSMIEGKFVSVREIIKYVSDNAGGVHKDSNLNAIPRLIETNSAWVLGEIPTPLRQLYAICKVTDEALTPLYEIIKA